MTYEMLDIRSYLAYNRYIGWEINRYAASTASSYALKQFSNARCTSVRRLA
jgi:hypothetical protein